MGQRVTTIVPTYRRPRLMARAVRSALNQTYQDLQVDIYDNASDDETAEVALALAADDPRVRYHRRLTHIGMVENFADGQQAVTTEFFSFLADDDVLLPEFYQRAVAALNGAPGAMFVASPVPFVDARGRILMVASRDWPIGLHQPPESMLALLRHGHFVWTGTMFRRAATEQVGTLDPKASVCSDLDFQLRIAGRFPFVTIAEMGAIFSWHEDSATSQPQLGQFWPSWEWIAGKLAADGTLPEGPRQQAARVLRDRLPQKIFLVGLLGCALGRSDEVAEVMVLLQGRLHRPSQATLLRMLAAACRRSPRLRAGLSQAARRLRWIRPLPRGLQAEIDRRYRELLIIPAVGRDRRKDSAA